MVEGNNNQADDGSKEEEPLKQRQEEIVKAEQTTSSHKRTKRRLSKKEQKALKKQRKQRSAGNDGKAITKSHLSNTTKISSNDGSNHQPGDTISTTTTTAAAVEGTEESINYLDNYKPIPIPKNENLQDPIKHDGSNHKKGKGGGTATSTGEGGDRSLGKWFPNALVIKSSVTYHNAVSLHKAKTDEGDNHCSKKRRKKKKKKGHDTGDNKSEAEKDEEHQQQQQQQQQQNIRPIPSSSDEAPKCSLVLFYQYANPQWGHNKVSLLIRYLCNIGRERNLGGRIRVASEGVNATISCVTHSQDDCPERTIRHFAQDLIHFDKQTFSQTDFKYIDGLTPDRHFKELKILPVKELVYYGIREDDAPLGEGGVHLDPVEYHEMMGRDDAVVIDVRNHYEADIGRFDGQTKVTNEKSVDEADKETVVDEKDSANDDKNAKQEKKNTGAEYIDPRMRKSTDFPEWLSKSCTKSKLEGKTVLMYCTGGVRCERASAYLKSQMGNDVKGVYQLKGGIEKYLQTFKDGGYWTGKNFVFDKREAIGVGNVQGDGGVIRKTPAQQQQDKKKKKKNQEKEGDEPTTNLIQSKCCTCNAPWDRYVGKKKCYTCGVPVLMCDSCMSKKPDKTPGKELTVRCPLCVAENITVPAKEVEYTANGVRNKNTDVVLSSGKEHTSEKSGDVKLQKQKNERKAAASVLKWGGGHATKKKERRKMKRTLCQFGSECVRKDCFFAHPEREERSAGVGKKA